MEVIERSVSGVIKKHTDVQPRAAMKKHATGARKRLFLSGKNWGRMREREREVLRGASARNGRRK